MAAAAAAAAAEYANVRDIVLPICGINNTGANIANRESTRFLELHGIERMGDFARLDPEEAKSLIEGYNATITTRGANARRTLGISVQNNLKGLIHWAFDRHRRGEPYDIIQLNEVTLQEALADYKEYKRHVDSGAKEPTSLRKFDANAANDYETWDKDTMNRLASKTGAYKCGMDYIGRRDPPPGVNPVLTAQSESEKLMYQLSLNSPAFRADNTKVYRLLQAALSETPAEPWVEDHAAQQDGRAIIQALREHYEGEDMVTKRDATADKMLKSATYTGEQRGTFESFTTQLTKAYTMKGKNGQEYTDSHKVNTLLDKIQVPNNSAILMAKEFTRGTYPHDYQGACVYMATRIAQIFPTIPGAKKIGTRNISGVDIGQHHIEDIRDVPDPIWERLTPDEKRQVFDIRNKNKGGRGRGRGGGRGPPHRAGRGRGGNQYRNYNYGRGGGYRGGRGGRGRGRGGYGRGGNQWRNNQWSDNQGYNNQWNGNQGGNDRQINAVTQQQQQQQNQQQNQQPQPQQQGSSNANAQQGHAQGQGNKNNGGGNRGGQHGSRFGRGAYHG